MNSAIVQINEVPTEIIAFNRWIEEGNSVNQIKDVIIIITGNHGIPGFYNEFAEAIQSKLSKDIPIWIIGHAGHTKPPKNFIHDYPDFETEKHFYNMNGNVQHKIHFIKKFVPSDAKIHIIGHSIGSWIILEMLKDAHIANSITKCYLLFPVIERMAETSNGQRLTKTVLRMKTFLVFLSWLIDCIPYYLKVLIIRIISLFHYIPPSLNNAVLQMIHPEPMKRVLLMTEEELNIIKERDDATISQYKKKLFLYYGANDAWTPSHYIEDLKSKHPGIDVHVCKKGFHHCFVLKDSTGVGQMIGNLLSDSILSGIY